MLVKYENTLYKVKEDGKDYLLLLCTFLHNSLQVLLLSIIFTSTVNIFIELTCHIYRYYHFWSEANSSFGGQNSGCSIHSPRLQSISLHIVYCTCCLRCTRQEEKERWLYDSGIYSKYCFIHHYLTLLEGLDMCAPAQVIEVILTTPGGQEVRTRTIV